MNGSPKIKQARDQYFRKIIKINCEKLKTLLKYQKKARQIQYFEDEETESLDSPPRGGLPDISLEPYSNHKMF